MAQSIWATASFILVSGCAMAAALAYLRGEALRSGEQLSESLVHVIEEQTSRTFQAVDQRLQLAAVTIQAAGEQSRLTEESARSMLREQLTDLSFVRAIWVLDREGRIVFDSDVGNIGVKLADREYFQVYARQPTTGFHLSAPVRSRSVGTWLISASRPLRSANGELTGVIVAAVEPPYFDRLWRAVHARSGGAVVMFRRDATLMLRSPIIDAAMGRRLPSLALFAEHLPKSPQGSYETASAVDPQVRFVSYRALSAYPHLIIALGRTRDDVLGPWTRFAALTSFAWLAVVATAILMWVLRRRHSGQYQRSEARFGQLAQAMPQIVLIADSRGRLAFVNDQWTQTTGQQVEEALARGWVDQVHPDDLRRATEDMRRMLETGENPHREYRLKCRDGAYRWHLLRAMPNNGPTGRVVSWYGTLTDIDELKQAQIALVAQTELLRMAGDMASLGGWKFDQRSMHFTWTDEANAILGLPAGSAPTLQLAIGLCAPKWRELATRVSQECLDQGTPFDVELQMVTSSGQLVWVRAIGRAMRDADGSIAGMHGAIQDVTRIRDYLQILQLAAVASHAITQQQTLEATLQEAARQVRSIVGAHQAVIGLVSKQAGVRDITAVSLSERYAQYQQLMQDPIGARLRLVVCDTSRPVRKTQADLFAHPDWRAFGTHAGAFPVNGWLTVPLTGLDGASVGYLQLSDKATGAFTAQDEYVAAELAQLTSIAITNVNLLAQIKELNSGLEEKIAQRTGELARQEALFRALAEQAPQPIWTTDPRGSVTFLSRAFYELVGGSPPDWHGDAWVELIHPDDRPEMIRNWLHASRVTLSLYTGMRRILGRDGSYHTTSYRVAPVLDSHGEVSFWVGVDADVTEIMATEAALRLANDELRTFSYSVSHDLRSPLAAVHGFSRALENILGVHDNAKVRHYLARIRDNTSHMDQLIEGLLALAELSQVQIEPSRVDLSAMANQILERHVGQGTLRAGAFHVEPGLVVRADPRLMRSVMENLLGNACKFSAHTTQPAIAVGWSGAQGAWFVRDNGAGFDMAYAGKLFAPFQRLHAVSDFAGTGIGLATVSRVIVRHGGRIWAESSIGQGATFYFTLSTLPVDLQRLDGSG